METKLQHERDLHTLGWDEYNMALNTIGHHIRYLWKQTYNMRGDLHTLKKPIFNYKKCLSTFKTCPGLDYTSKNTQMVRITLIGTTKYMFSVSV